MVQERARWRDGLFHHLLRDRPAQSDLLMTGKRTDANHTEIVNAFRKLGATVHDTSAAGKGFPDIVVGWRGRNLLVEIKDGRKAKSRRRLRETQVSFRDGWRGQYVVVESVDDVIRLLQDQ